MSQQLKQLQILQQSASNPNNSAWVFASAGSGKTKVLTDRVLRLLLSDVSAGKVLCLTFTKVAALEMQNRINARLAEWMLCDDQTLEQKLKDLTGENPTKQMLEKARVLLIKTIDDEAKIRVQTIHAFCQDLIKIFPFETGVQPAFEILEDDKEKLLLKQAQREVIKEISTSNNNFELKNQIKKINTRLHEESFTELVSELLNKKEKLAFLQEKFFGIDNVIAEIFKNFSIKREWDENKIFTDFLEKLKNDEIINIAGILESSGSVRNFEMAEKLKRFLVNPTLESFSFLSSAFFTDKNLPRKISGKIASDQNFLRLVDDQINLIQRFLEILAGFKIANDTAILLSFTDQILQKYSAIKKQKSLLDYNDLIVKTNQLLTNPDFAEWVKFKMDSSFDHILIDESQDTNHYQWSVIKALTDDFFSGLSANNQKRSIFIVGDEKQSIYSFQGAEPNISEEIFSYFTTKSNGCLKKIELNYSFRSSQAVLDAVDKVFEKPQYSQAISKVAAFCKHQPIRDAIGHFEIWPQVKSESKEKDQEWNIDYSAKIHKPEQEIMAQKIADKITDLVKNQQILESTKRPAQYGDFMVLLRVRTGGFVQVLEQVFHQQEIPFASASKVAFDNSLAIQDLLSAAKFALLPDDDLNCACLLKSPIFNFSEENLLEVCLFKNREKTNIYDALAQIEKFLNVRKGLEELHLRSLKLNVFQFFFALLQEKRASFVAVFGFEIEELLDQFLMTVFDFSKKYSANLQKFLEFSELLNPKVTITPGWENRVKISTVHSAKGLEAPIVFLPDCCYNFHQMPATKEKISWVKFGDETLPIWQVPGSKDSVIMQQHRQQKLSEVADEYLRLLYVAMTRAQDHLYAGGFGNAQDSKSWYQIMKE